jgi:hypothetical protein
VVRARRCVLGVLRVFAGLAGRLPAQKVSSARKKMREAYSSVDNLFQVIPLNGTHRLCLVQLQRDRMIQWRVLSRKIQHTTNVCKA